MDSPASPTAHSTYMRMKLAAAMHLLRLGSGGDPLVVSEEDWELAGVLADDSAKTSRMPGSSPISCAANGWRNA